MAIQGLDRAVAPPAAKAKQMLDSIGGRWWNVYIGGPSSLAHGWSPEVVKEYAHHGIERFMLTYAGRQVSGPLTHAQGQADARDALRIARGYGYTGDFPLCLDVEMVTFNHAPVQTVEYVRAWCAAVRKAGARPGVYANPGPLKAMASGKVPADFVWVASWLSRTAGRRDPHAIPNFPGELWSRRGARAWQYAGAIENKACEVLGLNVDINVADLGCLAHAPGAARTARSRQLRRGDTGPRVQRLTGRLSRLRSRGSGETYLDGPRPRLDAEAEAALKAFQREHRLAPNGVYGPRTATALRKAVQQRRTGGKKEAPGGAPTNGKPTVRTGRLRSLIEDVQRLDAQTDRAWDRLVAHAATRRRMLSKAGAETGTDKGLAEIAAILRHMQQSLETLVTVEQRELAIEERELALEERQAARAAAAVAAGQAEPAAPSEYTPADAPPASGNGAEHTTLSELTDEELEERIARLDRAIGRSRAVLMRRYVGIERELAKLGPAPGGRPRPRPQPGRRPRPRPHRPRPGQGGLEARDDVSALQGHLNRFTAKYLEGVRPLAVDGKRGRETTKRTRRVKYYLGYTGAAQRSLAVGPRLFRRMDHPRSPRLFNPAMLSRGIARRRKQHHVAKAAAAPRAGVASFEGEPVAAWLKPYLDWARKHGWQGGLNSGYRTPEESEQLCFGICGAPRCSGTCAGRTSNHSGRVKPSGAIDVTDEVRFGELMKHCPFSPRIFNDLPSDRVHFSSTGH